MPTAPCLALRAGFNPEKPSPATRRRSYSGPGRISGEPVVRVPRRPQSSADSGWRLSGGPGGCVSLPGGLCAATRAALRVCCRCDRAHSGVRNSAPCPSRSRPGHFRGQAPGSSGAAGNSEGQARSSSSSAGRQARSQLSASGWGRTTPGRRLRGTCRRRPGAASARRATRSWRGAGPRG